LATNPISSERLFLEKITTRNIIALGITATVLTVILQMTFNAEDMLVIVKDNTQWVVTGAFIFGALIAKFTDVIQFYFRKPQGKESKVE